MLVDSVQFYPCAVNFVNCTNFLFHKSGPNNNTYLCVVNSLPNIDL